MLNKVIKKLYTKVCLLLIGLFLCSISAHACTLYSAAGDRVANNGTLIAKIRDQNPTEQFYYTTTPDNGYKYWGLYTSADGRGLRAGINEKGLVLVTATAGTIPKNQRLGSNTIPGGLTKHILSSCSSVAEVTSNIKVWGSPQIIMIADKREIAYVEIGLNNKYSITKKTNGTLSHTNHFINDSMSDENYKTASESSLFRIERIEELLSQKQTLTLQDFIEFSHDQVAGNNNSIWRVGNSEKPNSVQSLAAFIIYLSPDGNGEIFLKVRENPEDKGNETIIRKKFNELFD